MEEMGCDLNAPISHIINSNINGLTLRNVTTNLYSDNVGLMQTVFLAPVLKWAVASLISVPLCFLLAYYVLLRVPVLKKIL